MIWKAGQKLNNSCYTIEQQLGEGGYGITYLARDKQGNKVVIKTLKDELLRVANYHDYQKRFWEEIQKLSELSRKFQQTNNGSDKNVVINKNVKEKLLVYLSVLHINFSKIHLDVH